MDCERTASLTSDLCCCFMVLLLIINCFDENEYSPSKLSKRVLFGVNEFTFK